MKKYIFAAFVAVLSVTCFASYSFGVDEVQLKKLLALGHCPKCDLSGADLSKADLRGADLMGANLREARLWAAKMSEADLTGANLSGAEMSRASIVGAILCNTKTPWGLDNSGCK